MIRLIMVIFVVSFSTVFNADRTGEGPTGHMGKEIITFSLHLENVTLHEPVIVNFVFENSLSEPINVDLGRDRTGSFQFLVIKPDGGKRNIVPPIKEGIARLGNITVQPGQVYRQRLLMNEWIDFSTLGKYELEVRLTAPVRTQRGQVVNVNRNFQGVLEVVNKDNQKLTAFCENFYDQFARSVSYEQAADAILAIGYMKDSVAVPYLEKALKSSKLVETLAIKGLERIGTPEAVQALISALGIKNRDVAIQVQAALVRLEMESTDPSIKSQIKQALNR